MTKILKKSLACLLAFVLCFTAIASCLAVSAEAPALSSFFALYAQRPSNNDKAVGGVCEGELLRAQLDVTGLTAGTTMGIAITMPEGVVREDITVSGWNRNTACALNIVSDYLDEETNTFTMVVNVVSGGSYTFFVRFNVTENIPKNSVMKMNCTVEAATTSAAGDENIYTYNSKDAGHERPMEVKAHDEVVDAAVAATCEGTGLTEGSHCSRCEKTLVAQEEVAALGHAWDEGVVDPDATCTDEGVITYTCANDPSHTYTEAISAKGHTPADALVNNGDNHSVVCDVCGAVLETADHEYVDGTCACGATEVTEMQPDETLKDRLQEHRILIDTAFGFYYNFYIPVSEYDYDSIEVHVSKPEIDRETFKYTGETDTVILTDADEANQNYAKLGMFRLNYANISLFEMNIEINTTLYLFKNGEVVAYYDYGEKTLSALANEYYEKNINDTVKRQFAVSLLNLGTAAQQYFADIKPDGNVLEDLPLPNADMPDITDVPDYGTLGVVDGTRDPEFTKVQLEYEKAPSLYYTFYKASTDLTNCTFTVSYQSKNDKIGDNGLVTYTAIGSELGGTNKDSYLKLGMAYISFGNATLYDTNKVVTTTITDSLGNVIATHQYSVLSRLSEVINETGLIGDLYRATATFSAAATLFWPDFA